jgi:invasion protein IalB
MIYSLFSSLRSLALIGILSTILAGAAQAETSEPKLLGTFGDWSAYAFAEGDKNVCYILSSPKKATGNYKQRGEIFALVTHRPGENTRNVFSVMGGYTYKSDSQVTLMIDKNKFALFTHSDSAWAPDTATDTRIADSLKKGKTMTIKGTSNKGTETTDTYGLKGTGAAFAAIDKACPSK